MTAKERAALYESAGLPLCLWTTDALRYVAVTVAPPPPTRPRWVKSDAEFQAIMPELRFLYCEGDVI